MAGSNQRWLYSQGNVHCLQCLIWCVEGTKERTTTMLSTLKNNAAAGYQGPVKIELLKGVGLLIFQADISMTKNNGIFLVFQ